MADGAQARITAWVFNNLELVFRILRQVKPTVVFGGQAFVTRFDGVTEVLTRDDVFHVPYGEKMDKVTRGGNFFLGMQKTPIYTRDVSNMRLAVRREDIPNRIVPFVESNCEQILAESEGEIDVVNALTRVVPARLIGDYFGTPGWDREEFTDAAWSMFNYLFYPGDTDVEIDALARARMTCDYLDKTIEQRKNERGQYDDVLERCIALQDDGQPGMTDLDIRNNLIGLLIGAIPTTSKCAALTLDYLFDHPEHMAEAQRAARDDDDGAMLQYVRESLRLNSFAAGVQRICSRDYTVNEGSWRATKIPAGTSVLVATQSAMMDRRVITNPDEFRLDRPESIYMHYGFGLHTCFGQYINDAQIPAIVKTVLKLKGLRRVAPMQSVGPFPVSLPIAFESQVTKPITEHEESPQVSQSEAVV